MIAYHGTQTPFKAPFNSKPTFFAKSAKFATIYADCPGKADNGWPLVLECEIPQALNWFNCKDLNHVELLQSKLPDNITYRNHAGVKKCISLHEVQHKLIKSAHNWDLLETEIVMSALSQLGFDGHIAREKASITYCLYNPTQVKIINVYDADDVLEGNMTPLTHPLAKYENL